MFIRNFNTTPAATGMLEMDANIQYLCTLVCGESLRQFYLLSAEVEKTETTNVDYNIKGLAFFSSFFWSGLQGPKAYSLWGGVVPSPSIG